MPTEAPVTVNPLAYIECCTDDECSKTEICYGSCWRTYNFEIELNGDVLVLNDRFGCESTTCTPNYQDLACYFSNARQTGLICSQCCGGLEWGNDREIDIFKQRESQFCNALDRDFPEKLKLAIEKTIDPIFGGSEKRVVKWFVFGWAIFMLF